MFRQLIFHQYLLQVHQGIHFEIGQKKEVLNPFNTEWTLPTSALGQLKSSVGAKGLINCSRNDMI